MSDLEPDLPDYLIDAILSEGPPPEAVDLVKNAFTWRTVEAELMELSYDSALDLAGVRDASARRTIEFTFGDISVIIEIDGLNITGRVTPAQEGTVTLKGVGNETTIEFQEGSFALVAQSGGPASLVVNIDDQTLESPAFVVG